MATFNPRYVNLDPYEAAQISRRTNMVSPLDALLQGAQQGIELQQLPGKLQDQALARQINNAINQQKLMDLQNPNQALARELQKLAIKESVTNPNSGIIQSPIPGQVISTPQAIPQTALGLESALQEDPNMVIPSATPNLPITPIGTGSVQTGLSIDQNVPLEAEDRSLAAKIKLALSRPYNQILTKDGYFADPRKGTLSQAILPTDPNTGLEEQRRQQALAEAQAKYDAAAQLATTKAELDRLKQERDQKFKDEQGDKRDATKLSLADKRQKDKNGSSVESNQYIKEDLSNAIASVDTLISRIGPSTVGLGASVQFNAPNSPARDFGSVLEQLRSQIMLGTLAKMKALSKNGSSGLGAVSNREGKILEQVLGSMDQFVGQTQFKENMTKIRDSLNRWNEAIDKYGIPDESKSGGDTTSTTTTSSGVDSFRKKHGLNSK